MSPKGLARQEPSPQDDDLLPEQVALREGCVEEYLRLLNQGIDVCVRWEQWSDRQFAALAKGDIATLVSVSARQARLVDAFFRLEYQWQQIQAHATTSAAGLLSDVAARREDLLAAAERVFAANYRNLRALNALGLLSTATEPLVNEERAGVYDRQGHKGGHRAPVRKMVDREG